MGIMSQLEEGIDRYKPYYQAVDDALVCWEMTTTGNAKVDLNNLICMEQQVCIDPAVSLDARTLIRSGRIEAASEICELLFGTMPNEDGQRHIAAIKEKLGIEI